MPIKIKLVEGEYLLVDVDIEEWNKAFQRALDNNAMLEIQDPSGRILAINPHQVLYLEAVPEDAGDAQHAREPEPAAS